MKGITFTGEPVYGDSVSLLVLSAPGMQYNPGMLAKHFYGSADWDFITPPLQKRTPLRIPPELLTSDRFRYPAEGLEWKEFVEDVYDSVDFVLFYSHENGTFYEVSQSVLAERDPVNYAFAFFDITLTTPSVTRSTPMSDDNFTQAAQILKEMLGAGWSASAISQESGVNPITLSNIKNNKASRLTDRVFDRLRDFKTKVDSGELVKPSSRGASTPSAGVAPKKAKKTATTSRKATAGNKAVARPAADSSLINTNYVPVDIVKLQTVIDGLIANFSDAIEEMKNIRRMIDR
jgi:hypothetical protein